MTNTAGCEGIRDGNAPVFAFGFDDVKPGWVYSTEDGLPNVCTSIPRDAPSATKTGRVCKGCYKPSMDPDGEMALFCGSKFYTEGMNYGDPLDHQRRIDCFEAAELLYLHAAAKGHPYAFLNLGYVYSYDRCEGDYWGHWDKLVYEKGPQGYRFVRHYSDDTAPYPCDERAYECYRAAAKAGVAEACYKLGDMLRDGRGCEMDLEEAFAWFSRAYELGTKDEPVVWGSAALRLGHAHEEGEGCVQSFEDACSWYELATTGLGIAVRYGEGWYRSALRRAERGFKRVQQELSGKY